MLSRLVQKPEMSIIVSKMLKAHSQVWGIFLAIENPLKMMENTIRQWNSVG